MYNSLVLRSPPYPHTQAVWPGYEASLPHSLFFSFNFLALSRRSLWARLVHVPLLSQSGFLSLAITLSSVPSIVVPLMGSTQRQMESSSALVDFFPLLRPFGEDRGPGVPLVMLPGTGRHCSRLNLPFRSHSILESFCRIIKQRAMHVKRRETME